VGQAITRIESLTSATSPMPNRRREGAEAMASQAENTRRYLDELVAVVGMRSQLVLLRHTAGRYIFLSFSTLGSATFTM